MNETGGPNNYGTELKWTRREALQGLTGIAAASILPATASAVPANKHAAIWPEQAIERFAPLPFNSDWRFHRGDLNGAESAAFDHSSWRVLDVPHDWSVEDIPGAEPEGAAAIWTGGSIPLKTGPFDAYASEGQTATGWTVGGIGWYRKSFDKPTVPTDGQVELRFEGVYMNCDVWLNGVKLGSHPYGYTQFAFDLTPHLNDGQNVVAVKVNNSGRNSRWYSGSGIFRKVWLNVAGNLRIPEFGISLTTPQVSAQAATVNLDVTVQNTASAARAANVRVRLLDAADAPVGQASVPIALGPHSNAIANASINLSNPMLWSPSEPNLYRAEVVLESAEQVRDATSLNFGIRKIEIDSANGLRINGKSIKLQGGCVHHDNGVLGSACIPRAEERRVETLKASGYNAIRTSHNPPSRDFLDACDRIGMVVIDEAFDCWEVGKNPQDYSLYFKDWWQRDLEAMILRDRNHPSVIIWSIGNEIPERANNHGVEIGKALQEAAHKLDPTRPVTAAICAPWDHPGQKWSDVQTAFTYLDVGGYNYQFAEYANDHANFPQRTMVGTESFPNQAFQNWQAVEKNSFVLGDFVWTAIDYLGESGIGHARLVSDDSHEEFSQPYPWFNAYCGDIDLIGNKKPQSYFRDVVWHRSKVEMAVQRPVPDRFKEYVSLWGWSDELRSWTWPGMEGKPLKVRVYTRGDKVTLLLNGKVLETKSLTGKDSLKAEFTVPYSPGELQAVAYQDEAKIGDITFTSTGKPHKLALRPDRIKLKATRDDLSYVMVQVVDEAGRLVPDAVIPVSFSVTGAGELAAVGSANPKDNASFRQPRRNTFHGECVLVVRPSGKPDSIKIGSVNKGLIEITAAAEGLQGASLTLEVAG